MVFILGSKSENKLPFAIGIADYMIQNTGYKHMTIKIVHKLGLSWTKHNQAEANSLDRNYHV